MTSPLAFDKQGNPISFHRRTRQLRVRLFRNPSARGTCSHVLDADGSPLFIDADTEYPVFRQLVGNVPGLYRLDQCDDDGTEVEDAPAAYITIDPPRNAQGLGSGSDDVSALAVIREMAAVQREMAAIQGQALKALAESHAQILASAAEVMRAPRPAPVPVELRNAADDKGKNDDDDEDDEDDDEYGDDESEDNDTDDATPGAAGLLAQLMKMIDPKDARKLGSWLMGKYIQFRQETAATAQPAAPPVNVAAASANVATAPADVPAAPVNVAANTAGAPVVVQVWPAQVATEVVASEVPTALAVAMSTAEPTTSELMAEAARQGIGQVPSLTEEQLVHIAMINAQLSPEEQATAEQVMRRMGMANVQRWLVAMSAMSVNDATAQVRQAIAERSQAIAERNQRRAEMTR